MKIANGMVVDPDLPELTTEGRDLARNRSGDCADCAGCGLVTLDATDPAARHKTASATCRCVHGRWIRFWHHSNRGAGLLARLPALTDVIKGRVRGWEYRPDGNPTEVVTRRPA